MKILFPYMARWHAVNWTRYHSLLSALAEMGHEVHVLQPPSLESAETNYQEIEVVDQANVIVRDVPINQKLWKLKLPFEKLAKKAIFSYCAYRYAKQYLKTNKIDVVLLYNIPQFQFSSLRGNVVQVFDFADDYVDMLGVELGKFSNPLALGLAGKMLDKMMKNASLTLSVSHELATLASGNVHVLPNGVGARKSIVDESGGDKPVAINAAEGVPVVGFIGAFEYFIDFDVILEAAKALPNIHFLLVGTGRDWQTVKQKVETRGLMNVELTGGVPHIDVFKYIHKMDVCLNIFTPIPVSHRACPIKLFEYLSQKKPVISTRLHELKHIDEDFLYYADTAKELIDVIEHVVEHKEEAHGKAMKGYQVTMEKYTWEKIGEQFLELVEQAERR